MLGQKWMLLIAEKAKELYKGRKIIIWGYYEVSWYISQILEKQFGIQVYGYVDNDISKIDNIDVFSPEELDGNAARYFVIIPLGFYQSIKDKMLRYGYSETDYYYYNDCLKNNTPDYYEDKRGNRIFGKRENLKVIFNGNNSTICLGSGFICARNSFIHVGSSSVINMGGCRFEAGMEVGDNVEIEIGNQCLLESGFYELASGSRLTIGEKTTIGIKCNFTLTANTRLTIGKDCMLSWLICFRTADGHSIFDIRTGKNISSTPEILATRKIDIGNHVWIGMRTTVLYNTEIGDGSIIGANSLVKGKIPNNCTAAGNPARVLRRDVAWCRKSGAEDILECGEDYINYTTE